MAYPYDYGEYGRGTDPRWRRDDDWDERRSWTERDWAERRRDPRVAGRRFGGAEYRERSQGGERDRENREEVLHGGDRGWPGGVRGAEGGAGYGRGWFAEAYGLY